MNLLVNLCRPLESSQILPSAFHKICWDNISPAWKSTPKQLRQQISAREVVDGQTIHRSRWDGSCIGSGVGRRAVPQGTGCAEQGPRDSIVGQTCYLRGAGNLCTVCFFKSYLLVLPSRYSTSTSTTSAIQALPKNCHTQTLILGERLHHGSDSLVISQVRHSPTCWSIVPYLRRVLLRLRLWLLVFFIVLNL